MTALLERAIAPSGRSRAEYITLRVLAAQAPHGSNAELIDFLAGQRPLGLGRADVVTMLDRLRADGLVTAAPAQLTAAGHNLLQGTRHSGRPGDPPALHRPGPQRPGRGPPRSRRTHPPRSNDDERHLTCAPPSTDLAAGPALAGRLPLKRIRLRAAAAASTHVARG